MSIRYSEQFQKVGTITVADPAVAVTVDCGWTPRYVRAISEENLTAYEWFAGMTGSIDVANHDTTQMSINAANGISVSGRVVTFGTDICDTAADTVHYIIMR